MCSAFSFEWRRTCDSRWMTKYHRKEFWAKIEWVNEKMTIGFFFMEKSFSFLFRLFFIHSSLTFWCCLSRHTTKERCSSFFCVDIKILLAYHTFTTLSGIERHFRRWKRRRWRRHRCQRNNGWTQQRKKLWFLVYHLIRMKNAIRFCSWQNSRAS